MKKNENSYEENEDYDLCKTILILAKLLKILYS